MGDICECRILDTLLMYHLTGGSYQSFPLPRPRSDQGTTFTFA